MRFPDATKRTVVLGRTGSGKTVASVALFSKMNWTQQPWTVFDFKGDELIEKLQETFPKYIKEINVNKAPPKEPGIYIARPHPSLDDEAVENYLWACWQKQRQGLYVDEGYMIPRNSAGMRAILTQGRSRRVPLLILYQRPVYMSIFARAQADFIMAFDQNDEKDLHTTQEFMKPAMLPDGSKITVFSELPKYWSLWYDVGEGQTTVLRPAPPETEILEAFDRRFSAMRKTKGVFI